eukprot:4228780-Alexandrium_andersonii.AAC.1
MATVHPDNAPSSHPDDAGPVGMALTLRPDGAAPGGNAGEATPGETTGALHPDDAGLGGATLPPRGLYPSPDTPLVHRADDSTGSGAGEGICSGADRGASAPGLAGGALRDAECF